LKATTEYPRSENGGNLAKRAGGTTVVSLLAQKASAGSRVVR